MSLNKGKPVMVLVMSLVLISCFLSAGGQSVESDKVSKISLLIIDETKTFQQSMKIEVFARNIKKIKFFNLSAKIVDVKSSYQNPLEAKTGDNKYDLILIFPKGLDNGKVKEVWILSAPINYQMEPLVKEGIKTLSSMIEKIFQAEAMDVGESLFPALLSGILLQDGWIRS